MARPSQSQSHGSKQTKTRPEDEIAERDLDKVSGGASTQTTTPPAGPVPIPYPNSRT